MSKYAFASLYASAFSQLARSENQLQCDLFTLWASARMSLSLTATPAAAWVICLCAQWCGTCRGYQAIFEGVRQQFGSAQWHWVDVEDLAHVVDPEDVLDLENFPTLLVAPQGTPTFFGPLTPQPETLQRLLQAKLSPDAPALNSPEATDLLQRLQMHFS
jgi:thiol-disulfide isomerase/thioredoxin